MKPVIPRLNISYGADSETFRPTLVLSKNDQIIYDLISAISKIKKVITELAPFRGVGGPKRR